MNKIPAEMRDETASQLWKSTALIPSEPLQNTLTQKPDSPFAEPLLRLGSPRADSLGLCHGFVPAGVGFLEALSERVFLTLVVAVASELFDLRPAMMSRMMVRASFSDTKG